MVKSEAVYTLEQIKEKLFPIFQQFGISRVSVFGSYARDEATTHSDLDILISTKHVFDLEEYSDFEDAVERAMGKTVHIIFFEYINEYMREGILNEAVSIYEQ